MQKSAIVLAAVLSVSSAQAADWSLEEMNKAIDGTNFLLNERCSATLISVPEKLLLTNYHCIDNLVGSYEKELTNRDGYVKKVKVRRYQDVPIQQDRFNGYSRIGSSSYVGVIEAENQQRDLAIVSLKGNIPHTYASSLLPEGVEVVRGERVYVVGNPALNYGSLVEGIVSSVNRTFDFPWTQNEKLPMIQFSGGIFGGNSGGALYNSKGQLIGVPAAGFTGANFIGLAVPVDPVVKAFLRDNCWTRVFDPAADDANCRAEKAKAKGKDE